MDWLMVGGLTQSGSSGDIHVDLCHGQVCRGKEYARKQMHQNRAPQKLGLCSMTETTYSRYRFVPN